MWGMREEAYNALDVDGKVFTVRIPFVVCEVRKPLLSLATMEDKGFYMTVEGGCRILGGHGRAICLRRQGNSNHVDMEFTDGTAGKKEERRERPVILLGSGPAIDNDVAALSVAAGVSEKGTALVGGYSIIADVGERRAVANSTLEMPSRETVKSHQLAHIPFVPWSRTCVAGQGHEGPHFSQMGGAEIVVLSDNTSGELERLQRTHKKDAEKLETAYQKLTTASEMILRLVKAHDSQAEQVTHSVRENECLARDLMRTS